MKRWPVVAWLLPLLCLAGAWIAFDLSVLHYRILFGDLASGGVCGGGGPADCGAVIESRYGQWAGVPVSVWGFAFYSALGLAALGLVLLRPEDAGPHARFVAWGAALALLADAWLGWAMAARLERLCPLCAITYAIDLALFAIAAFLLHRARIAWIGSLAVLPRPGAWRADAEPARTREALKGAVAAVFGVLLTATLVATLTLSARARALERDNRAGLLEHLGRSEPVALSEDGAPARGPAGAPVTLVVFSDLLCEQCRRLSRTLEIVGANHRGRMRVVYRHFPMDSSCNPRASSNPHPGACEMARAAACAARQGRFWEFEEAVWRAPGSPSPERIEEYAATAGLDLAAFRACRADESSLEDVRRDVRLADSLGITSTPTTFLNGRALVGAFKPWLWEDAIEAVTR